MIGTHAFGLILTLGLHSPAAPSRFETPFQVQVDGATFYAQYPSPTLFDWDGDGRFDLLVGSHDTRCGGYLRIYRNIGEPGAPAFSGPEEFHINGEAPRIPGG